MVMKQTVFILSTAVPWILEADCPQMLHFKEMNDVIWIAVAIMLALQ